MNIVVLDAETYFDQAFSLRKLTTEEYCRSPQFEVLGWGIRWPDGHLQWATHEEAEELFKRVDWAMTAVLAHHAQFDLAVLNWRYGVIPSAILDTLSMARLLSGNHVSGALDSLAKHYKLAGKTVDYASFKGKHWADLSSAEQQGLAAGCLQDVNLTWDIFCQLAKDFPVEEYAVVDATVRMFTEPALFGDVEALGKVWVDEAVRKRDLLANLGLAAADLQSSDRFVELLRLEGVAVPTKPGTAGEIPCIAKTDQFMKDLLEDENERVRGLAEARLGVRSTINQTRAERMGFAAGRGALPVYLGYCGAHTTRWSGGDKLNYQNFPRGGGIRSAICAPKGHQIIKADKSQIECRVLNRLAGQTDVVERFRREEDPYVAIASKAYGESVYKPAKDDPRRVEMETKRGTGKQLELSCGYGAGGETIVRTAARGTYGPPVRIDLATGLKWRDLYRDSHPYVVAMWRQANRVISRLAGGERMAWTVVEVEGGKIILPNGCPLLYPELQFHRDESGEEGWRYRSRKGWVKLYGAKLVENLIQALSRIDMSQTLLRLRAHGLRPVLMEHDAAAFVVLDKDVDAAQQLVRQEFCRPPTWLPDIPLDCEISVGERYS